MAYAGKTDMEARFPAAELIELTAKNGGDAIDDGVLANELDIATATIDSYLSARYAVPLASVPDVLVGMTCDIARYHLYPNPPEAVLTRYRAALAFLRDVQKGVASLPLPGGSQAPRAGGVAVCAPPRRFSRDSLEDYSG